MIQNIQNILNFSKKKIWIFWERGLHRVPKRFLSLGDLKGFHREDEANILGRSLDHVQWIFVGF